MKVIISSIALLLFGFLGFAQNQNIPIHTISDSAEYANILNEIASTKNALYVFDVDNTLLITNNNLFGSDWWYAQTKTNPNLKLNINNACLFDELTPLFYAVYGTTPLFQLQPELVNNLGNENSKTIALTSRGFTESVGKSTDLELREQGFEFMQTNRDSLGKNVVLMNNVIYTKGQNKGNILMNYVQQNPFKMIYYFDDSYYKVEAVQQAFLGTPHAIKVYHVDVAPKINYTPAQLEYMQEKLCILIETLQAMGESACSCNGQ